MYIYIYVYIHVYIFIYIYIYIHSLYFSFTSQQPVFKMYKYTRNLSIWLFIYVYICLYLYRHIDIYMDIYINVYTNIYIDICTINYTATRLQDGSFLPFSPSLLSSVDQLERRAQELVEGDIYTYLYLYMYVYVCINEYI
jgi:hypothetical protein